MYVDKNPYHFYDTLNMHDSCSNCGLKYEMEPSFFYGSMYVSYGLGVAFAVTAFIVSFVIFESSLTVAFIAIIVIMVTLSPVIMRLSRNIWINLFVKYEKDLA
jgi:uncharacterized protein (DUF983 family)